MAVNETWRRPPQTAMGVWFWQKRGEMMSLSCEESLDKGSMEMVRSFSDALLVFGLNLVGVDGVDCGTVHDRMHIIWLMRKREVCRWKTGGSEGEVLVSM